MIFIMQERLTNFINYDIITKVIIPIFIISFLILYKDLILYKERMSLIDNR